MKLSNCKIANQVAKKIIKRANLGKKKYGKTLERNDLSYVRWLEHLQEELLDGANYIQKLIDLVK